MTMKVNHLSFPDVSTGKIWVIITNPFSQTRHVSTRKRILKVKIFSTESFSTCMKYTAIEMNLYFVGDNNHLGVVVRYLEVIYTTLDYPKAAPALNVSLRDSGKSRADLWAFAAHVALERTIERANWGCEYDFNLRKQQTLLESREKCDIKLTNHFPAIFMYGRSDCVPRLVVTRNLHRSHPVIVHIFTAKRW